MLSEKQYLDLYQSSSRMIKKHSAEALNAVRDAAFEDFRRLGFPSRKNRNDRVHSHLRRQGCTREAIIVGDVGYGHIHIFGIFDCCRINRVLIII